MNTQAFGLSMDVEPSVLPTPPLVLQKPGPSTDIEMKPLNQDARKKGPGSKPGSFTQTPMASRTLNELEMSRPPGPQNGVDIVQTFWNPDYDIGYAIVSIIFVSQALGFVGAAFVVNALALRFGRAKTLMVAEGLIIAGYVCLVTTPPFPVVVIGFFIAGVGMAMNLAITQVFVSNLASSTTLLGIFQGCYGIGGVIGPLVATTIVSRGAPWSRYYLLTLSIAVFNFFSSGWSFWHYERDASVQLMSGLEQTASRQQASENTVRNSKGKWQAFKALLGNKPTFLGALFIFAYQGAEVSISGWVISFLVQYRNGDLSRVGYVTAGFWGGITLGRFVLSHSVHYLGERKFVFVLAVGALILELLVWFVPSIPGDSVAVALSGFLLGPIYPAASNLFARLIPRQMQVSSFSFIASIGSSGGAMAPFLVGMLA